MSKERHKPVNGICCRVSITNETEVSVATIVVSLCCAELQALYERLNVTFLLNDSDTIVAYEEQGKQKTASAGSLYQRGMDAFTSLGRIQQIELLQGKLASLIRSTKALNIL